ncbi:hypothetical protein J6590_035281 [Homalodisca vitripennis]|nr:hypothetical protein J6590_035281 [Homalodisca vitripennis]
MSIPAYPRSCSHIIVILPRLSCVTYIPSPCYALDTVCTLLFVVMFSCTMFHSRSSPADRRHSEHGTKRPWPKKSNGPRPNRGVPSPEDNGVARRAQTTRGKLGPLIRGVSGSAWAQFASSLFRVRKQSDNELMNTSHLRDESSGFFAIRLMRCFPLEDTRRKVCVVLNGELVNACKHLHASHAELCGVKMTFFHLPSTMRRVNNVWPMRVETDRRTAFRKTSAVIDFEGGGRTVGGAAPETELRVAKWGKFTSDSS